MESGKSKKTKGKKKKKTKPTKTVTKSTKKEKEAPDTSKDEELAKELGLGRAAKTPSAEETKRKAAISQYKKDKPEVKNQEDSDDLDFGDDNDDDSSDEEYADESKPWMSNKKPTTRRSALENYSDEDDYDDDNRGKGQKTFVEADLEDFMKVTIPRRRLSRWCNEPYFEEAVMNFYVRLAIGRDNKTQKPCYRLSKIIGVASNEKEYKFPPYPNQKPVATNKWLKLKVR